MHLYALHKSVEKDGVPCKRSIRIKTKDSLIVSNSTLLRCRDYRAV